MNTLNKKEEVTPKNKHKHPPKTTVMFRKFDDDTVIALFPYEIKKYFGSIGSKVAGWKRGVSPLNIIRRTKPATKEEFQPLKEELERDKYKLRITNRINNKKYFEVWKQVLDPTNPKEVCIMCGVPVHFGSGNFVNRVPSFNTTLQNKVNGYPFPEGEWICSGCDNKTSDDNV